MSRLWQCGFEQGHIDVFDSVVQSPEIVTDPRTGVYSIYVYKTLAAEYGQVDFSPSATDEVYVRVALFYRGGNVDPRMFLGFSDNASDPQITFVINEATSFIEVRHGDSGGAVLGTGTTVIDQTRWYVIEAHFVIHDAAGSVEVRIDGVTDISVAGIDTQYTANANVAYMDIGGRCWGNYDDIALNDTSGASNNSWCGQSGIYGLLPDGAGNYTEWTPSAGANWDCCDEVPPNDDTDYVHSGVLNQRDTYTITNTPGAGTIAALCWWARSDTTAAPENIARFLRIGGVDYQGGDLVLPVAYDYYYEVFDQDPNAGPGAWTVAAVDAMEAGVRAR